MEKLGIKKYFTGGGKLNKIEYDKSDITITDEEGEELFIQKDVEFPKYFSQLARKIVASRYFYGEPNTPERENSLDTLVTRMTRPYEKWGVGDGYFTKSQAKIFTDELAILTKTQKMSPNSPVWFNVGNEIYESRRSKDRKDGWVISKEDHKRKIETRDYGELEIEFKKGYAMPIPQGQDHLYPQTSACFIQNVDDTMEDIMRLAVNEAMLFKYGSGTGTDLSTLRSSKEKLSGGGRPSGPLAYLVFYDKLAGIVKSGGKTRRAAKMNSIRIDHPDIKEFITSKTSEEKKISDLIAMGWDSAEAVASVHYQNANLSVRITDEFMKAVENDEEWQTIPVHNKELADEMPKYKARELFYDIAVGTHMCGDPGIQFHDTINKWHTCPKGGEIKASNPCSEYVFLNNSSCNLASLNLRGFIDENGKFNIKDFKNAIRTTAIAMDLNYNNSCFPTKEITQNSFDYRPLGMGFANLGSLVMSLGLPYDSEEARNIAGAITSLLTSTVYEVSTEMAEKIEPFKKYEENKESMKKVIKKHKEASLRLSEKIENENNLKDFNLEEIINEANSTWENAIKKGGEFGYRNAQATVLAPTGTIGFMMDCDTKGIEPEIGLVQTKLLAEGGTFQMVNGTIPFALEKLGYDNKTSKKIQEYIFQNKTAEGCELLNKEHLAVFDCSNKPKKAKRTISYNAHIDMMAAVQPFLSGAISKTVNMPKEATIEEIEKVYLNAWKKGLKAVAIYRDGSKSRQPMSFDEEKTLEEKLGEPIRRKLPNTRKSITHKFNVAGHEGYFTVGLYENKTPGELFITMAKEGKTIGGLMNVVGIMTSMALQYGVPLKSLHDKLRGQKFEPHGYIVEGDEELIGEEATSIVDYVFNWMGRQFLKKEEPKDEGQIEAIETKQIQNTGNLETLQYSELGDELGKFCPAGCGRMVKKGHCTQICPICKTSIDTGCAD